MYSYNQVRHLYVHTPQSELVVKKDAGLAWYKTFNALGEFEKSDILYLDKVCSIKLTKAAKLQRNLKKVKVTLKEDPIVGQDYIVHINIKGFVTGGDETTYAKFGAVHVTSAIKTKADFAEAMAKSLTSNFKRDVNEFFTFKVDGDSVVIAELPQPWRKFWMHQVPVNFDVTVSPITADSADFEWAVEEDLKPVNAEDADYTEYNTAKKLTGTKNEVKAVIKNGKTLADMEYFYHGERGDMYRGVGYPNNLETEYLIDPTKEYDVVDIHFYWNGANHAVQKSEKDLTIAIESGQTLSLDELAEAAGVKVVTVE